MRLIRARYHGRTLPTWQGITSTAQAKPISVDPSARIGPLLTAALNRNKIETQELYKGMAWRFWQSARRLAIVVTPSRCASGAAFVNRR